MPLISKGPCTHKHVSRPPKQIIKIKQVLKKKKVLMEESEIKRHVLKGDLGTSTPFSCHDTNGLLHDTLPSMISCRTGP